jgi:hypothetical protein
MTPRTVLLLGCLLAAACDASAGLIGQTSVAIDIRFSRTARDPQLLSTATEEITLAITGEGLSKPIETTLAPVPQIVAMQLPPGYKDFVAQAWRGNRLLAQGEAGVQMAKGKQTAVILDLAPIDDAPGAAKAMAGASVPGTGLNGGSLAGTTGATGTDGTRPMMDLSLTPGIWPSPIARM